MTVTSKRQVTFPKAMLDAMGVKKGDRLVLKKTGKKIVLEPIGKGLLEFNGKFGRLKVPKGKTVGDLIDEAVVSSAKNVLR